MASFTNYLSTIFGKKPNVMDELETKSNSTRNLKSDANAADPNKAWVKRKKYLKETTVIPLDPKSPIPDRHVRFVCISDTHTMLEKHRCMEIPYGDVLLHAGDLTMNGHPDEVHLVNEYLGTLPHKHKVVIAGNHDKTFDLDDIERKRSSSRWLQDPDNHDTKLKDYNVNNVHEMMTNCIYLQDSTVEICGIKIYGSPWTPGYGFWGFQRRRGQDLMEKWNKIPNDTDILITHCPPCGYGDNVTNLIQGLFGKLTDHVGCVDLLNTVNSHVKPKYHVYGHIHEGYGMSTDGRTTYINASTCTQDYAPKNPPILFDVPIPVGHTKDESVLQKGKLAEDLKTTEFDSNNLKQSKSKIDDLQKNVHDKNFRYEYPSYRPDGKTNYEKLAMDGTVNLDDQFDDSDDDCCVDSDSDEDVDSKDVDKNNTCQGVSEADDGNDCDIVFDDNCEGIQIHY